MPVRFLTALAETAGDNLIFDANGEVRWNNDTSAEHMTTSSANQDSTKQAEILVSSLSPFISFSPHHNNRNYVTKFPRCSLCEGCWRLLRVLKEERDRRSPMPTHLLRLSFTIKRHHDSPTNLEGPLLMTKEGQSWSTRAIDAKNRTDFISANLSRDVVLLQGRRTGNWNCG